ncbi:MAG: hypothetical protein KIT22_18400, partial [Verrucomicrobiae bacterium]|nr:hypothetical protein [Verrucomicrobiae bacterium]
GVDIPDPQGTNASLTLPAVTEADAGQYRVRVTFGTTSVQTRQATLIVTAPGGAPTFTEQPAGARLHLGESLTLRSEATGDGPLTFAWTRGETSLPDQTASVLSIAAVTGADAGEYHVTVTGPGGSATSDPAVVTVGEALRIGSAALAAAELVLSFNGITDRTYLLERRENLLSETGWQSAGELVAGEAPAFRVPAPESAVQVFRIRAP